MDADLLLQWPAGASKGIHELVIQLVAELVAHHAKLNAHYFEHLCQSGRNRCSGASAISGISGTPGMCVSAIYLHLETVGVAGLG